MAAPKMSVTSTVQNLLFNKSLSTMVKGIRNHKSENGGSKAAESEYVNKCLTEIKDELKTNFPDIKAVALQKLIYLQMIGYDISWAAFHIIEVMSAAWFGHKRVGYLAASLSFTPQTDVILLTTHLFRKGFNSSQGGGPTSSAVAVEGFQYETGAAISCLANIVTPDLAQDLLSDVYGLMNSSRPYIRKKAVLVLLKIFKAWPKALRLSFDRLKEKLNDENQGVVSAAVYVICELASKNPKNYLSLAPQFFKILTTSSNNWVLIKVVKLLGSLVPLEPRLAKKLTDPLSDIISTTPAKSLLYECVNTLLCGELRSKTVVRLCLEKLRNFIEDADQNLKYLGLLGLHKLLQKQPRVVSEMKDLILDCLSDEDVTIRMRALDLITSMVSLKNLVGIISKLMIHLDASEGMGQYREHVLERILFICSQDNFAYISDFEWYVSILVDLTHVNGISRDNALKINQQLLEVVVRVPGVRSYTIKQMINILLANRLNSKPQTAAVGGANTMVVTSTTPGGPRAESNNSTTGGSTSVPQGAMCEVLHAVGFIIGEYAEYLESQDDDLYISILSHLTHADVVTDLPVNVQNVYVQNQMKVLSSALLQPFDNALVKDQLSTVKSAQPKRNTDTADDGINLMSTEGGDEISEAESTKPEPKEEEEPLPDEEEEDFDANGLRRRKHASLKRTFAQWHTFIAKLLSILYQQLPLFTRASSVEVQERAVAYMQFVKWLIVHGEFESKIEGWKSAVPTLLQPTSSEKPSATTSVAATPKTAPAVPVQAVVAKLDLLSLDPVAAANAKELSIFDMNPASSAAPVVDLFSALSTPAPAPAAAAIPSAASSSPLLTAASSPASSSNPAALKDKLRALAIQLGLLYAERLNPVHPKAQRKVQVPKGLDLDSYINPGCEELVDEEEEHSSSESEDDNPYSTKKKKKSSKPKGALYDDDDSIGSGGFGAKQYTKKSSKKSSGKDDYSGGSFDDDYSGSSKSEDKEEARKRQEKRRQQQMNDPYYIKDSSSSSSAALINVDNIPVKRLEDDDLPNLKVESKSSLAARASKMEEEVARRPHKTFKVLKHDDMPIDSDDDDGDKKKKKDKKRSKRSKDESRSNSDTDALDMDLTTPLKADEIMPRVKSYAESSAEKAEAQRKVDEAKAKAEGRKSSSKKKKHKKDDKDRDRSKERKSKKDKKEDKKDSPAKSTASSASPNLLDLFDMSGSAAPAASSTSSRKSISTPAPSSSPSSSSSSDKLREKTLYKDSSLKVKYTLQLLSGSQVGATLDFSLASDNPKKIGKLEKIVLEIKCGKYVRAFSGSNAAAVKPNDKGVAVTIRDLQAGANASEKINIEFSGSLDRSYELSARISYTADKDGKGKEHESCDLELPLSTFLVAKKVSPSEMSNLIVSSPKPLTGLAQSQVTLKKMKVSEVIRNIAPLLNVSLVEAVNFTATYYAVMTNQSSVCVLLKAKKGDESSISIEIKSISSKISEELLEEVTAKIK